MVKTPDYSPKSDDEQKQNKLLSKINFLKFWRSLLYLMLLSLGGGISYSWHFWTQKMIPTIEESVSKTLSRPIKLGKVQAISFTCVVLGESYLPSTYRDNDFVIAETVKIDINLFKIFTKEIDLKITLQKAKVSLKKDKDNAWLRLRLKSKKTPSGKLRVNVNAIAFENSKLNIQNNQDPSVIKLGIPSGNITLDDPKKYLFDIVGNLENGGRVKAIGLHKPKPNQWFFKLDNKNLPINTINQIVTLPVNVSSGTVTGKLTLDLLQGDVDLNRLGGEMKFTGVDLFIPKVPQTLTNSSGIITFKDRNVILKGIETNFGLINSQVQGLIRNYEQLDIIADTSNSISIDDLLTSLKLDQVDLENQGKVKGKIKITGDITQPLIEADIVNDQQITIEKIPIDQLFANFTIKDSQLNLQKLNAKPSIGGTLNATGKVGLGKQNSNFSIDWQADNILAEKVVNLYGEKLPIQVGMVDGDYNLVGDWQQISETVLTGSSTVELASSKATINRLKMDKNSWRGQVDLPSYPLTDLPSIDCSKIGCQNSIANGQFQASGNRNGFDFTNTKLLGRFSFNLAQGQVTLTNAQINNNNWQAIVNTKNVDVSQLPSVNLSSFFIKEDIKLTAQFQAQGNFTNIRDVDIKGQGHLNIPQGQVKVSDFVLKNEQFLATIFTNGFPLQDVSQTLRGDAIGQLILAGNINNLELPFINIDGNLKLTEGISVVAEPMDVDVRWNGDNLRVKEATIDNGLKARGIIDYDLDNNFVTGINLDVAGRQVNVKTLPLPDSLDVLNYKGNGDFQGKVVGDGNSAELKGKLALNNLKLSNIPFSKLTGNLLISATKGINLDLNSTEGEDQLFVKLDKSYQLQELNVKSNNTFVKGQENNGNLALDIENIPLDKVTQPWLSTLPDSVKKVGGSLSGNADLDITNYNLRQANIVINQPQVNHLEGDILTTKLTYNTGVLTFDEGSLQHQKNQYYFTGKLQPFIENPRLEANLKVKKGKIENLLTSLQFFDFADITNGFNPRQYGNAKDLYSAVNNSQIDNDNNNDSTLDDSSRSSTSAVEQEISTSANLLLGNDKDKLSSRSCSLIKSTSNLKSNNTSQPLISIEDYENSFADAFACFDKIEEQISKKKTTRENTTIPTLEELNGNFTGGIDLTASIATGVQAEFNFNGDYWQWGKYKGDSFQLTGSYDNGLLTFLPIKIESDGRFLALTGTFKPERISGEFTVSNLPVSQLKPFLKVPDAFDIEGDINASIAISGSQEQPLAKGNIEVVDSRINGNRIEKTEASFGFRNSRVDFLASSKLNEEIDYFTIIASVPFQLFSKSIRPENDNFNVDFNLTKEGFSLLSVVSDNQLNWVEGDGNIDLEVKGKYNQEGSEITNIETKGIANLNNAVINGKIFNEEAITNINGQVLFDFSQINVPNLTGNFSGGQILLSGTLPLLNGNLKDKSLNLLIEDLALNLEGLYKGDLQGNLAIKGSAIEPEISGIISLKNGDIKIPKNTKTEASEGENKSSNQTISQIKLNDLILNLGDNIHVTEPILLRLKAEGNLNINGDLNNILPEGIIKLKSGTVNLFTSQLKLVKNYDNMARFTPENGLNPYLDLQLESSVTETSRYQLPDNSNPNEIQDLSDFSVNTAQTIKVKANVKGRADNLTNNIELSSSPPRDQIEIVALLGGGFVNNFAGGSDELNLVNFASAAVLGTVQGQIQKALGFDELRLFPAQILDSEERTSTLGLGAELALDLNDNISVSVTKIFTNEQAPRFGIRYRLNEKILLRGSSDFEQDSRGVIEFQHRF